MFVGVTVCLEGILLTRTRLSVSKLVQYVHEQPQLKGRVLAEKLVGQGQRDGTMTDIQQENTLRRFRAGYQSCLVLLYSRNVATFWLFFMPCHFHWNVSHRLLVYSQLFLWLSPLSSSSFVWYTRRSCRTVPCAVSCSTCLAKLSSLHLSVCLSQFQFHLRSWCTVQRVLMVTWLFCPASGCVYSPL